MADEDTRTWAERRIDARRAERGLPTGSATHSRLVTAVLLLVVGLALVTLSESVGILIGVACLIGAGYELLVAAISKGVEETGT